MCMHIYIVYTPITTTWRYPIFDVFSPSTDTVIRYSVVTDSC